MYAIGEKMTSKYPIILALGSNSRPIANMRKAKSLLGRVFHDIGFSREIWTKPIGVKGLHFRNCIACATTDMDASQVLTKLKEVESLCGRTREESLRNVIKMDVDLLRYDDQRCHEKDWERPYIRQLMKEFEENNL